MEAGIPDSTLRAGDIREGLPHVFPSAVGQLEAADPAMGAIGSFLAERLSGTHP